MALKFSRVSDWACQIILLMGFSIRVECNFTSKAKECTQIIDSYFCTATSSKSVNICQDYVFCFCRSGRSASWFPGRSGSSAKPLSAPPLRWLYIPSLGGWRLVSSLQPDLAKNGWVAVGPLIVIILLLPMWEETSVSGQWSCLSSLKLLCHLQHVRSIRHLHRSSCRVPLAEIYSPRSALKGPLAEIYTHRSAPKDSLTQIHLHRSTCKDPLE